MRELSVIVSTFCIKIFATILNIEAGPKHFLFSIFIILMFLPEVLLVFNKSFRGWIKTGIEDSDGKFEKSDLASLLIHYSTLWCTRLYVFFGLMEVFYGVQVRDTYVVGSLAGAFGIEIIGFMFKKSGFAK